MRPNEPVADAEALAALIDSLVASGTQHINLEIGEQTRVRTVNSAECSPAGACAVPTPEAIDEDLPE